MGVCCSTKDVEYTIVPQDKGIRPDLKLLSKTEKKVV